MVCWTGPVQCMSQTPLRYLELSSCVSRSLEAQGTNKKAGELTLESLIMKSNEDKLNSPTDSEIKVHYAMVRRGLALQFAKLMAFSPALTVGDIPL